MNIISFYKFRLSLARLRFIIVYFRFKNAVYLFLNRTQRDNAHWITYIQNRIKNNHRRDYNFPDKRLEDLKYFPSMLKNHNKSLNPNYSKGLPVLKVSFVCVIKFLKVNVL